MTPKEGNTVTLTLQQPTQIDKVCYYIGIDNNSIFTLSALVHGKWDKFNTYNEDFPFSFRWKCSESNITTSSIRLLITKNQIMLGEVRLIAQGKTLPLTTKYTELNDESNITIDESYFGSMFFDEIYHSRTAYEMIHGISTYENTHPYLGKLLIIPGIKIFGMTPYGWRYTNVLFAAILIFVAYQFALQLFRSRLFAFFSSFLMTYSFMHLTQARIGLIDTFGVLFVYVSFYWLFRFIKVQKTSFLMLSGISYGLASAVKWSAVFAAIGYILIALYLLATHFQLKKKFSGYRLIAWGVLSYGVIGMTVYILTFLNIYLKTGSLQRVIDYQVNMFNYHSHVISKHAYSSPWWSWSIDYRPMCYYRNIIGDQFSSITVFGNPAIFWAGTASLFYLLYLLFKKNLKIEGVVILMAFIGLYLPYAFVGRQMFIYHFYYAVPFMMLSILYGLRDMMRRYQTIRGYHLLFFALVASLFLMFYPVLSGTSVWKPYIDNLLIWFPGWWL